MAPLRVGLDTISINPRNCGGHHTEIEMIGHGMGVPCLTTRATNFLFDLLESGFNFPTRAVYFDDLLDRKIKVGGKQSHPSSFTEDPNDANLATEVFEHHTLIIRHHLTLFAVEKDRGGTYPCSKLARQVGCIALTVRHTFGCAPVASVGGLTASHRVWCWREDGTRD